MVAFCVLAELVCEALWGQWVFCVVFAPSFIGCIQIFGAGFIIGLECHITLRIEKVQNVVDIPNCGRDIVLGSLADGEVVVIGDQPSQSLQHENRLNGRVRRFLLREGLDRYDPERFLDYKMGCVLAMLNCLREYDPAQGADFLTYAHHFIGNALLTCRMQEEAGSFENVDEYKAVRRIAWLYNQSGQSEQATIQKYAQKNGCTDETAAKFLALAKQNRSRVPFYQTIQDEDSEETGEDVSRDDHWDYAEILWNGIRAEAVREAFEKLNYREQTLLEKRNAICMTCGRVSPISTRLTFEELAVLFEGSTASGAERAYRKAVDHLACLLTEAGVLHMIRLKRKSQTKRKKIIAAAVYLYQVDNDGEWGEISFDFEAGTAEIIRLAEWDTTVSKKFAKQAIYHLQTSPNHNLPKDGIMILKYDSHI